MAKVNVRNVKAVIKNIEGVFEDTRTQKKLLDDIGELTVKRIFSFTKSGISQVTGQPFKGLSTSYIRFRRGYAGTRGRLFGVNRSNLTLTGQLLDSLMYKSTPKSGSVEVGVQGRRTDGKTNKQVAQWVSEQGREFLGLDDDGKKRVRKLVLDELRREIKRRGFDK